MTGVYDDREAIPPSWEPARLGTRVTAAFIDGLLIFLTSGPISFLARYLVTTRDPGAVLLAAAVVLIWILAAITYVVVGMARGQSLGKRFVKIVVLDRDSDARIGAGRALLRWFVLVLMIIPLWVGVLFMVLDRPRYRGWHDRAARSRVVSFD